MALIAIFASNPTKAINATMAVVHSTTAAVQWVRSEWLMVKLTVVEWIRKMSGSKVRRKLCISTSISCYLIISSLSYD